MRTRCPASLTVLFGLLLATGTATAAPKRIADILAAQKTNPIALITAGHTYINVAIADVGQDYFCVKKVAAGLDPAVDRCFPFTAIEWFVGPQNEGDLFTISVIAPSPALPPPPLEATEPSEPDNAVETYRPAQ
ncbi:MAG: hypothetical protein ABI451_04890 [Dokdonella sp.]